MPLLAATGVSKFFGRLAAINRVDVAIEAGEIVGLIGPNGAGKSTLVNVITGMEAPAAGRVEFDGTDITGRRPAAIARLGIARTFQIAQPFRNMSVRQNVAVPMLFRAQPAAGVADALRRADEVLDGVGLGAKRDLPARALTTPDLRRLELAKAVALRPRLMLLDEVMAGLTPAETEADMALLRRINEQGITLLVIEHVLRVVMGLCRRVVVLHHGSKIAEGPPQEVTSDPAVIAAYLGPRHAARGEADPR
ncbi:MAG TPA: ABC transporter ATP-binding protein [bacterium]|nr:ABC transporter ATP-binding protein [bacterium]